jgi:paraquat-inducible protein B
VLTSDNLGSVGIGSPVYYRRLQVGQVVAYKMADDGKSVSIKVFVNAPYDKFVNSGTRFWNASGIDASVGAGGVDIRTQSIVAILAGGLAFDTPPFAPKAQPAAAADAVFVLYNDQATAMKEPDALAVHYALFFNESLRGLSVGAPVTLLGLQVGEVTDVGIDVNPKTMNIRGRVEIVAYPERLAAELDETQAALGKMFRGSEKDRHALLQTLVEQHGLRAQLTSGSLVTGQLYVAFDYFPNAPKVKIDWSRKPAELPVVASTLTDIQAKITGIVAKLDKVPLEAIGADVSKALVTLDQMLQGANKTVTRIDAEVTPELKTTIEGIRATLVSADGVLKSADATLVGKDAPAQQDLRDALQEITRASRSLRVLSDYLERHPESLIRGKTEEKP